MEGLDAHGAGRVASRLFCQPRWDALPEVEPTRLFRRRSIQALEGMLASYPGSRVAVINHTGVINAYLSMLLDIPRDVFFSPDYASISIVRYRCDSYAVRRLNDTGHLSFLSGPAAALGNRTPINTIRSETRRE